MFDHLLAQLSNHGFQHRISHPLAGGYLPWRSRRVRT